MKQSIRYFAYGSNMHPRRLARRVPSSRALTWARLERHRLCFHKNGRDGSGKCNVLFTGDCQNTVYGVVYQMCNSERHLLDSAEGLGAGYDLSRQQVICRQGREHDVFFYVAEATHIDENLKPYGWYKQLVVEGARTHGLPKHYLEQLRRVVTVADPDPDRTAAHAALLEAVNRRPR